MKNRKCGARPNRSFGDCPTNTSNRRVKRTRPRPRHCGRKLSGCVQCRCIQSILLSLEMIMFLRCRAEVGDKLRRLVIIFF